MYARACRPALALDPLSLIVKPPIQNVQTLRFTDLEGGRVVVVRRRSSTNPIKQCPCLALKPKPLTLKPLNS